MPRKKSIKKSAQKFTASVEEIEEFFQGTKSLKEDLSIWCAEYAVIRLYCEFEVLMLSVLIGAVNGDSSRISQVTGFKLPKHMSEDLCA